MSKDKDRYSFSGSLIVDTSQDDLGLQGDIVLGHESLSKLITPEELSMLVTHTVRKDIIHTGMTYPPDENKIVALANSFYDTYLYDTEVDKVDIVDRYLAELFDQLSFMPQNESSFAALIDEIHAQILMPAPTKLP